MQQLSNYDSSLGKEGDEDSFYGTYLHCAGQCCAFGRTWIPCLFCCFVDYPYQIVNQGYEGLIERFGKFVDKVGPGLHYINPCSQELIKINMKIDVMDLQKQNVITKDNLMISIDASVYFNVNHSSDTYYKVSNYSAAIAEVTYSIIKTICGRFSLQQLLEQRQKVADQMQVQVEKMILDWGINIQNIYIKDITLNAELQESLSAVAKERRLADSKLISAKADIQSAKLMRSAADILNSKSAMQIRYLETIKSLAGSRQARIIFLSQEKDKERVQHLITQGMMV